MISSDDVHLNSTVSDLYTLRSFPTLRLYVLVIKLV